MLKRKKHKIIFMMAVVIFMAVGIGIGSVVSFYLFQKAPVCSSTTITEKTVYMYMPAIDSKGNGVSARLETMVRPGTGKVLVNINNILSQYDTQLSGRMAAGYAGKYTGINMSGVDVIYSIKADADVVEGASAGASMAISVISALEDMPINQSVIITGTVDENGTIGQVGNIAEKGRIGKALNATLYLVPKNQSTDAQTTRVSVCEDRNNVEYCSVRYISGRSNVGEIIGINVAEVETVEEALDYYLIRPGGV
jgi:predicted S18 family serine protease